MVRNSLIVAALLLTVLTANKAAADDSGYPSKNAQKFLATLNSVGINNQEVRDFVEDANSHVENGYLNLAKQDVLGGELALRYGLNVPGQPRRLELHYAPEDSHFMATARTDSVKFEYRLKF